ncbi:hypothetical protein N0V90_004673 [Kalmusia sp. IMI 367209]|nr:hypothetical protein N0V90_004673 [Kalmusia sp. IMI 367209]
MAPKIFLTGGTGYIGGSVLHTLITAHPEYDITVLLRKTPDAFTGTYPNVKIVQGDYDSADILSEEASKADVVVHNGDSDHEPSLNALIKGLLTRPTPGYLLHLSGTGIVSDWSSPTHLGTLNPKIWSDISDIPSISSLPDHALHRNTEKILFSTAAQHADSINIAIMCPPDIYGKGKGLGKTASVFAPLFINDVKATGLNRPFYYNEGTNTRSWVHIDDLMTLYLKVVEAAVANDSSFDWNAQGYYFAGTQEHSHISVVKAIGAILKKRGVIEDDEPVQVSLDQIDQTAKHPRFPMLGRYLYASNSRTRAQRAEKLFGYQGKAPGLLESLEEDVLAALRI